MQKPAETKYLSLLVLVTGLSLLGLIFKFLPLNYIAAGIGLISLLIPRIGDLILMVWEKFGLALGWVNSRIILGIVFFLVLTPLALLKRIGSKDALFLKAPDKTTFRERNHCYEAKDLEKPW